MPCYESLITQVDTIYGLAQVFACRRADNHLEIEMRDADGIVMSQLSWNPHRHQVGVGQFLLKEWDEGFDMFLDVLLPTGLFYDTGNRVYQGLVSAPVWGLRNLDHVPPLRGPQKARLLFAAAA